MGLIFARTEYRLLSEEEFDEVGGAEADVVADGVAEERRGHTRQDQFSPAHDIRQREHRRRPAFGGDGSYGQCSYVYAEQPADGQQKNHVEADDNHHVDKENRRQQDGFYNIYHRPDSGEEEVERQVSQLPRPPEPGYELELGQDEGEGRHQQYGGKARHKLGDELGLDPVADEHHHQRGERQRNHLDDLNPHRFLFAFRRGFAVFRIVPGFGYREEARHTLGHQYPEQEDRNQRQVVHRVGRGEEVGIPYFKSRPEGKEVEASADVGSDVGPGELPAFGAQNRLQRRIKYQTREYGAGDGPDARQRESYEHGRTGSLEVCQPDLEQDKADGKGDGEAGNLVIEGRVVHDDAGIRQQGSHEENEQDWRQFLGDLASFD